MSDPDDEGGTLNLSIRLAIIAECAIGRRALRSLCASMVSTCIVAELSSAQGAAACLVSLDARVALLSAAFTNGDCLSLRRDIAGLVDPPSLIVIRIHPSRQVILELMGGGILSILDEQADEQDLETALATVARGDLYLGTHARCLLRSEPDDPALEAMTVLLTPRECDVLALVVDGETNGGVARTLKMSVKTVETHLSHIYGKLGVSCRVQAVVRAQEIGLLTTPSVVASPRSRR